MAVNLGPQRGPSPISGQRGAGSRCRVGVCLGAAPAARAAGARRRRAARHEPPSEADLGDEARSLPALVRAVRVGRSMYAHPDAIAAVRATVERVAAAEGSITLPRLRDELRTSRKYAQALLEHMDAARVTRRREDDSRVLRRAPAIGSDR